MRRLSVIAVMCTFALTLVGPDQRVAAAPFVQGDGFPAPGALPIVTLLSPGAAPRMALRYKIPAGTTSRVEVSSSMGMNLSMAGMAMPEMKIPGIKVGVDLGVTAVAANGDMSTTTKFTSMSFDAAGVDPMLANNIPSAAPDLSGMQAQGTMTTRGISKDQAVDVTKITDPQLKLMMDSASATLQSLTMPFPEEAVGVGARWEVRERLSSNGVMAATKRTVEVTSITGTKIGLKITMEQTAPAQAISNPMLPPGTDIQLQKMSGTITSTGTVDLTTGIAETDGGGTMAMDMAVAMQGMQQNMSMTMNMKMKVTTIR